MILKIIVDGEVKILPKYITFGVLGTEIQVGLDDQGIKDVLDQICAYIGPDEVKAAMFKNFVEGN